MNADAFILSAGLGIGFEEIVAVLFVLGSLLGQVLKTIGEQKKKKVNLPPPAVAAQPRPAAAPVKLEDALRREVEQFLRRAQEKPPGQPSSPRQIPSVRVPQRKATPNVPVRGARPSSKPTAVGPAESVAEHVRTHVGASRAVGEHARHLGESLANTDERLDEHLREKFIHPVGKLAARPGETAAPPVAPTGSPAPAPSAAAQLRQMLSSPAGARQLILAGEILRPPVERW